MPMLFNFLFGEGQARAYIIKGVNEKLSAEVIHKIVTVGGLTTRLDVITKVVDYLKEVKRPADEYIKYLQQYSLPNIARIPLSLTSQIRNFAYTVQVQGFGRETGEIETHEMTISSNELLSKQQAIDIVDELARGFTKSGGLESAAGEVISITQNAAGLVLP